ncbi:hypothetical protein V500_10095 [Pseudogymnoascus sp. VKM F-4518 (FW-2643)]|nr:hypothetical protein V500_10095 [Pseudogymnoascus sp. VKM F-4518 (FW-2643)]
MQRAQVVRADDVIKLLHRLCERLGCAKIIPSCEGVARIYAHPHALLVVHEGNHIPQILKARAYYVPGASHILKQRNNGFRRLVRAIQHLRDPSNRLLPWISPRIPGVEIIQPDAKGFAPREVVEETRVRLLCLLRVGLREVDEVGAVGEDVSGWVVGVLF